MEMQKTRTGPGKLKEKLQRENKMELDLLRKDHCNDWRKHRKDRLLSSIR